MAAPLAAKHARIAPHPASEARSRRDQMKFPLSDSGMPGFPPGIQVPSKRLAPALFSRRVRVVKRMRQVVAGGPPERRPRCDKLLLFEVVELTVRTFSDTRRVMGPLANFWAIVSVPDNIP